MYVVWDPRQFSYWDSLPMGNLNRLLCHRSLARDNSQPSSTPFRWHKRLVGVFLGFYVVHPIHHVGSGRWDAFRDDGLSSGVWYDSLHYCFLFRVSSSNRIVVGLACRACTNNSCQLTLLPWVRGSW